MYAHASILVYKNAHKTTKNTHRKTHSPSDVSLPQEISSAFRNEELKILSAGNKNQ